MAKEVSKISIRAYADHLGVDDKTIRKAIQSGKIKKGVSYKTQIRKGIDVQVPEINLEVADKEYGNLHKNDKVKPGQSKAKLIEKVDGQDRGKRDKKNKEKSLQKSADADYDEDDNMDINDEIISSMVISKKMSYGEASRRREIIQLALDKKKLQELEGMLVRRDEIEKVLFSIGSELKKSLFNIPARITADVRAADNDVLAQSIITIELTQILNEFSKMQELKLN
jgi:hypothetical protein